MINEDYIDLQKDYIVRKITTENFYIQKFLIMLLVMMNLKKMNIDNNNILDLTYIMKSYIYI